MITDLTSHGAFRRNKVIITDDVLTTESALFRQGREPTYQEISAPFLLGSQDDRLIKRAYYNELHEYDEKGNDVLCYCHVCRTLYLPRPWNNADTCPRCAKEAFPRYVNSSRERKPWHDCDRPDRTVRIMDIINRSY